MSTETKVDTIKWGDVNHKHHGKAAIVRTPSSFPVKGEWHGVIHCKTNGTRPVLTVGGGRLEENRMFAWWHDVELR